MRPIDGTPAVVRVRARPPFALFGRLLLVVALLAVLGTATWVLSRSDAPTGAQLGALSPVELTGRAVPAATVPPVGGAQSNAGSGAQPWADRVAPQVGVPPRALAAYGLAELIARDRAPGCHLSWATLAGIGRVRSYHGAAGGRQIQPDGTESAPLTLPAAAPLLGPMGLTAAQWDAWPGSAKRVDGGPQNVDAAAQAAAAVLCGNGRDLSGMADWTAAIRSYTGDDTTTVEKILAATALYGQSSLGHDAPPPAARQALDFSIDQLGLPYVWGGNGPANGDSGFDCSGLTTAAYNAAGIALPRTADTQYHALALLPPSQLPRPGDLVFWGNPAVIHHVGLYIGGGLMINAPTFGQPVQIATLRHGGSDYAGAARPAI